MLFFWYIILLPYYTIYISTNLISYYSEYNNIDISTKLIRQCNNLYKHWYIEKTYISYTYTRTWYIHIHVRTRVHAHTCVHVRTHTRIYIQYIYILSIYCVKIALNYT